MRSTLLVVSVGAVACLGLAACERGADEPSGAATADQGQTPEFAQVYTVRGQIQSLPDPADPRAELQIHHEEIPEFVGASGETVGMRAMTMPFPTLAPGVSLEGLSIGDKIRFTFGVVWVEGTSRRYPTWTVTAIEPLPPETELQFTQTAEPAAEPAAEDNTLEAIGPG